MAISISKQLLYSLFIIIIPWLLLARFVQPHYRADTCCDASILINRPIFSTRLCLFFSCGCSCCCFPLFFLFKLEKGKKKVIKEFAVILQRVTWLWVCWIWWWEGQSCRPRCERDVETLFLENFSWWFKSKSWGQKSFRGMSYQDTVVAMPFMSSEYGLSKLLSLLAVDLMLPSSPVQIHCS